MTDNPAQSRGGLWQEILADDDRTRRASALMHSFSVCLLYPLAIMVAAIAIVAVYSPVSSLTISTPAIGWAAFRVCRHWRRTRH